jgi:cytosine permease
MIGLIAHLIGLLIILGVTIPPIAGILLVDYFYLRRDRVILKQTRDQGVLPTDWEEINPVAIASWVMGSVVGASVTTVGIPAINALVAASLSYAVVMRLWGATRGHRFPVFSRSPTSAS